MSADSVRPLPVKRGASSKMIRRVTGLFSLALLVASSCLYASAAEPVEFNRAAGRIEVLIGGRPFTAYYFDSGVAKPYLHPLRSAQGTIVTRGFPWKRTFPAKTATSPTSAPCTSLTATSMGTIFGERPSFPVGGVTLDRPSGERCSGGLTKRVAAVTRVSCGLNSI